MPSRSSGTMGPRHRRVFVPMSLAAAVAAAAFVLVAAGATAFSIQSTGTTTLVHTRRQNSHPHHQRRRRQHSTSPTIIVGPNPWVRPVPGFPRSQRATTTVALPAAWWGLPFASTPIATPIALSLSSFSQWSGGLVAFVPTRLHTDPLYCLTAVLGLGAFGLFLERRTTIGKALSAPLATMAAAMLLANLGVIPFASPAVYGTLVNRYAVALAVPLLLFDSDLKRVIADTGSVLAAFGVGAVATVVGTLGAFGALGQQMAASLGAATAWKVAAALAARHIGGAINFVAVAETLSIPGTVVSAAIAADNVVVALYFAMLFALAKANDNDDTATNAAGGTIRGTRGTATIAPTIETELDYSFDQPVNGSEVAPANTNQITLPTISVSLTIASLLVTLGRILTDALLPKGTSSLPLTSTLTVVAATLFPTFFSRIRTTGTALGILFIQMFFAASGASGSIALVLAQAPSLFAFSTVQIAIHFMFLMGIGRGLFRLPVNELYLASNANVGGPTTAAAMAQAKNWKRLVLPALLVGILGYATATGIALALGSILVRLPILLSR